MGDPPKFFSEKAADLCAPYGMGRIVATTSGSNIVFKTLDYISNAVGAILKRVACLVRLEKLRQPHHVTCNRCPTSLVRDNIFLQLAQ